jgi:hypothetical protein
MTIAIDRMELKITQNKVYKTKQSLSFLVGIHSAKNIEKYDC